MLLKHSVSFNFSYAILAWLSERHEQTNQPNSVALIARKILKYHTVLYSGPLCRHIDLYFYFIVHFNKKNQWQLC